MPAPQHRNNPFINLKTARTLAMLAASGIVLQTGCLGQLESGLDLVTSPSTIANALRLPTSPLMDLAEFLIRAWF